MGQTEKSPREHLLHGTKSQTDRTKPVTESHVQGGRPKFPADIRNDKTLRAMFKQLCRLLAERRALTRGDRELIRLYVFIHDRHRRNLELLRQEGELVTYVRLDSNGQPHDQVKQNLRLKIVSDAEKQMVQILSQLGLSPTAKDRARPTSGDPVDQVVPGSCADVMPEMFSDKVTPIKQPTVLPPPTELEEQEEE